MKPVSAAFSRLTSNSRATDILVAASLIAATLIWTALAGQDLNWDQLHYHFYLPFSMLEGRLQTDFMAANVQSYLNPVPYIPFYWMVRHDWPPLVIGCVLGGLHATNIVLAYFITKELLPGNLARLRIVALLGAALAFVSPLFLMETATSFADITTSVFVLLGVLLLVSRAQGNRWYRDKALYAGICIGIAAGLKLTNLIFAPAIACMLLSGAGPARNRVFACALALAGGLLGVLVAHGYWSFQLWREFGNPFFPLFNSIFASPDFAAIELKHERFLAHSLGDLLLFPLRALQLRPWVYVETSAPDLRYASILIAGFWCIARAVRTRHTIDREAVRSSGMFSFWVFLAAAYLVWALTSGNGRYGLAISLLCGPALAVAAWSVFRDGPHTSKTVICALGTLLLLQCVHMSRLEIRWMKQPWSKGTWYGVSMPQRLQKEPNLYVTLGPASNSYIAPFVAKGSAFTNHAGQVSFDLDGPGGDRIRKLIHQYSGRTRMIATAPPGILQDAPRLKRWQTSADALLLRIGLTTDPSDCLVISTSGTSRVPGNDFAPEDTRSHTLLTCALQLRHVAPAEIAARARVTRIFEKVVEACPQILKPHDTVVEQTPKGWFASYINTDSILRLEEGYLFITQPRTSNPFFLGTESQWETSTTAACKGAPTRLRDVYNFDRAPPT